ncbi:MAG: GAF domain-containing protein, partial [Chitinophagaceae bacterium]|nr:GAF domain-containing protein [Anaerolineae bacterium]
VKEKGTLPGEVFSTGQPVLIGASGPQKVKTEHLVNSLLYVPILVKSKPIGVLGVNNKTKKDLFDVHQQQLLVNLASFASIAIENARIHQESLEHARELQTLVGASQVMNASLSMQEIVPTICLQLANVIDVGYTEILKWDKDGNRLTTLARYHRSIWRAGQAPVMEVARQPMLKATLENDRHRWLNRDDPVTSNEKMYLEQVGAAAMLMIPIRSDKQVLGALRCFFVQPPDEPPPADMIQRARNIGIECLVNLANQNEQFHSADIFRLAAKINQMTEANWCDLSLLAKGGATLSIHARIGSGLWLEPPYSAMDLTQHQELLTAMQSQTLIYQGPDNKITPAYKSLMDKAVSRSVIGVPLVQRGKVEGLILFADTERSRVFNEGETHLTQAIVGQAATALENSTLVRDLGKSLRDLKDTQERLVQTARLSAMGELAAVVAHQINNPLTTIIVDTELMLMDEAPTSRNYSALTAIHRAGKRAANVARRLLAIARPHDPNAIPEMVDVVDTVRGILSLMQTHIERANIRIIANLPDDPLPAVLAIKGTLDDIWLNLLMNAHDALIGWEDSKIGIEVYFVPERKCINVVVWDNGPGIPENIRSQIFSPFFTTKPVGEGTGLGLHICREVVENVGGTINVESVPSHHTSFIVRLPVIAQNEVQ